MAPPVAAAVITTGFGAAKTMIDLSTNATLRREQIKETIRQNNQDLNNVQGEYDDQVVAYNTRWGDSGTEQARLAAQVKAANTVRTATNEASYAAGARSMAEAAAQGNFAMTQEATSGAMTVGKSRAAAGYSGVRGFSASAGTEQLQAEVAAGLAERGRRTSSQLSGIAADTMSDVGLRNTSYQAQVDQWNSMYTANSTDAAAQHSILTNRYARTVTDLNADNTYLNGLLPSEQVVQTSPEQQSDRAEARYRRGEGDL